MTLLDLFANPVAVFLIDLVLKATALLSMAIAFAAILRKSSAAIRHRVWSLTFAGLLLLPALSYILPELQLPILPAEVVLPPALELAVEEMPDVKESAEVAVSLSPKQLSGDPTTGAMTPFRAEMSPELSPWELNSPERPLLQPESPDVIDRVKAEAVFAESSPERLESSEPGSTAGLQQSKSGSLWLWIWVGGLSFFVLPVLNGLRQIRVLSGLSESVDDSSSIEMLDSLRAKLSIQRRVRLVESEHSRIPLTWGPFSPVILFPVDWRDWTAERRRLVLLHELAHVKRWDVAWQLLARLVSVIYWFHPLSWLALKRLKNESELACDDSVLMTGESPQRYASELIDLARSAQRAYFPAAVAMAQTSNLEQRIRALLDRARSRLPLGGRLAGILCVASLLTVAGIAAVTPVASEVAAESESTIQAESPEVAVVDGTTDEPADDDEVSEVEATDEDIETGDEEAEAAEKENKPQHFRGVVVDPDGKPVAGARVRYLYSFVEYPPEKKWISRRGDCVTWPTVQLGVFHQTTTDENGRYKLSRDWSKFKREREQRGTEGDVYSSMIVASANVDGEKPMTDWIRDSSIPNAWNFGNPDTTIQLKPAQAGAIRGRLIDLEGRPIAGARVTVPLAISAQPEAVDRWVSDIQRLTEKGVLPGDPDGSILGISNSPEENSARFPTDEGLVTGDMIDLAPVVSDEQGRFEIPSPGDDCLVVLRIDSKGNAAVIANVVTREIDHIAARQPRFHGGTKYHSRTPHDYHGSNCTIVVPPSQTIEGVIRDADTQEPIPGITVAVNQGKSVAETDAEGRYRLTDVALGDAGRMSLYPRLSLPYFSREYIKVPAGNGTDPIEFDLELKAGVWIEGRVFNHKTGKGLPDFSLHYMRYDKPLSNSYRLRFWTDEEGNYRLLARPGRGIVGAISRRNGVYRTGFGAENIEGFEGSGDSADLIKFFNSLKAVDIPEGVQTTTADLEVDPGGTVTLNVQDQNGQPLEEFKVGGDRPHSVGSPRTDVQFLKRFLHFEPAQVKIQGLAPEERRPVLLLNEEQNIGLTLVIDADPEPGSERTVKLQPLARVTGRIVDGDGNPVQQAAVRFDLKKTYTGFSISLEETFTDSDGKLDFSGLLPGGSYGIVCLSDAFGVESLGEITPQPGETIDLGEIDITKDERPEPKRTPAKMETSDAGSSQSAVESTAKTPDDKRAKRQSVVSGTVVDPKGQPVGGVQVAVIARRIRPRRGGDFFAESEAIVEGTTNSNGEFELALEGVSSQTHHQSLLIARKDGVGMAWGKEGQLDLDASSNNATLKLFPEEPIRGRLIDIEGQPASGVRLLPWILTAQTEHPGFPEGVAVYTVDFASKIPAAWIPRMTTDEQGRFTVRGVPAGFGVVINVEQGERFAPQRIALNTGQPEQRGERDGTYRWLIKNVNPGEEASLALSPAQIFEGVVRYQDTGEPAPHARLTIWASQGTGSMVSVAGKADAEGRYRIVPNPGIQFGVTAYPPDGVPYLARRTPFDEAIDWKAGDTIKTVDVALPRGVLVNGKVVERGTGKPVAGASIQYVPEEVNNKNTSDDILTGWQDIQVTDEEGVFEIAVLPGPGRLLAHGPGSRYVLHEISSRELSRNQVGGDRNYAHAIEKIDPEANSDPHEVTLELQPGETVSGRVVDEQGNPVIKAVMITRLAVYPTNLSWMGSDLFQARDGRFELNCLAEGEEYPVYFFDAERKLGASVVLSTRDKNPTVVLEPCGQARMRLVDSDGKPVADNYPTIHIVVTPGVFKNDNNAFRVGKLSANSDFISNIDRRNYPNMPKSGKDGELLLPVLIPGATYQILDFNNQIFEVTETFKVRAGENLDLGDVVVERQE